MPVINSETQPRQTFSGRLQRYWEHPHPYGLIAMLKSTIDSIDDAVNGSIATTGAPPSTEEEAFRYNQTRDRGAIGAYNAASSFSPAAPEFVGASVGRRALGSPALQAIERFPRVGGPQGSTSVPPYPSVRPDTTAGGWQPSVSGGSVPNVPPSSVPIAPSGGLLARLRELDAMEQPRGSNIIPALPERDPNFRQLTRVRIHTPGAGLVSANQMAPSRTAADEAVEGQRTLSLDDLDIPEFLRRQPQPEIAISSSTRKSDDWPKSSSGRGDGSGGGNGDGGGGGGNEEGCKKERRRARDICIEAFANGFRGDGKRWKSNYATGPYKNKSGKKWDISDCMRGHISKDCGGNKYDEPPKPKIRRIPLD